MLDTETTTPALPDGALLFHIGLPKTGTTALQVTAAAQRARLLDHGVLYPGRGKNHRRAVSALMGRRWGWQGEGSEVPPMKHWDDLRRTVDAETVRRVWIGHEFASESDDSTAQKFAAEFGQRLHVVLTLRSFPSILASSWQQYLKSGTSHTFDHWLRCVLADPPDLKTTPSFHRRNNQSEVVKRWAGTVGPERVTAVIVDKSRPTILTDAFEDLLALPRRFLVDDALGGLRENRTMSAPEAELLRALNKAIKGHHIHWRHYETLVRNGAVARLLDRSAASTEPPLQLPAWAAARASEISNRYAEEVANSGVQIIGDIGQLARPPVQLQALPPASSVRVPSDLAVEALAGMMSAATGRGPFFSGTTTHPAGTQNDQPQQGSESKQQRRKAMIRTTSKISSRELIQVLITRVYRKARRMTKRHH